MEQLWRFDFPGHSGRGHQVHLPGRLLCDLGWNIGFGCHCGRKRRIDARYRFHSFEWRCGRPPGKYRRRRGNTESDRKRPRQPRARDREYGDELDTARRFSAGG